MKEVYKSGVSGTPPAAGTAAGYPQDGVPGVTQATILGAGWVHMISQELTNIVTAAGITPSATVLNQVLLALQALFPAIGLSSFGTNGYFSVGGFWLQWGTHANAADNDTVTFPHGFPTACYGVLAIVINNSVSSNVNVQTSSWNQTTFNLFAASFERPPNSTGCFWIAVGH